MGRFSRFKAELLATHTPKLPKETDPGRDSRPASMADKADKLYKYKLTKNDQNGFSKS